MTIQEMKRRKQEWGYTDFQIAELSGVPLETVQKIFAGETKNIEYRIWNAVENAFREKMVVMETAAVSGGLAFLISTVNVFRGLAPSWAEADGMVWLLLDLSVALLPLFYLLVVCMVLLPPYYMLKKRLPGRAYRTGGETKSLEGAEAPEKEE